MSGPLFDRIALIGIGLIGSSIARSMRANGLAGHITVHDANPAARARTTELGLADHVTDTAAAAATDADLVVLCTPIGAYGAIVEQIAPNLKPGAILTDVGSVKGSVVRDLTPLVPAGVSFVPGHPMAGTEQSGPDAGFPELFQGRWALLTPPPGTDPDAVRQVSNLWSAMGSTPVEMSIEHHDQVVAIVSHLPHLIAYTIVGTATELADELRREVINFSAAGFRDFTRIAASDPIMWRDVFLNNREAVLEMLQRFNEDLTALQKAIRVGDGEMLQDWFTRTREIRRGIIEAGQA